MEQPRSAHPDPAHEVVTDDFLELPAFAPPACSIPFQPGTVLANRFEILRHIARGGMGDVFDAYDRELGAHVALKTVRGDRQRLPGAHDRFRREVLRARAVSHRNVCRVFDLFTHQQPGEPPIGVLTMQLVEGETLSARLARMGPFAPREALRIAVQIAAGIDEAHRLGIIHRDLKPGNVMLSGPDRHPQAVVTDFGLALDAALPGDASEAAAGTIGYAAPEQLTTGSVGPAADIYAFGALLHVMLTTRLPDRGAEEAAALVFGLPVRWARAIARCLDPNPARRPASATAVLAMVAPARHRAGTLILGALVAGMALSAGVLRFLDESTRLAAGRDALIADVINATGEADLRGVTALVRRQLEQSPFLKIVTADRLQGALRAMGQPPDTPITADIGREIMRRTQAGVLTSGTLRRSGNGYVLTVRVEMPTDATAGRTRSWARSYEARDREELRAVVERGSAWIRATVGERPDNIERFDRPAADVTTGSWRALDLYTQAEALLAAGRQDDGVALLDDAMRIDPDFAAAWMRAADVLMSRRDHARAYEYWTRALQVLDRKHLGTREEFRIRGMFASDTHDFAEAERVYRLFLLSYPNDFAPYFYIARPLLMLGRPDEAVRMMERASLLDPTSFAAIVQLSRLQLRLGRFDAVRATAERLKMMGQADWADSILVHLEFLEGNSDAALRRAESLERADESQVRLRAPALQAAVLAETGRTGAASARLERSLADPLDASTRADRLLAIASLRLASGDRSGARSACVLATQQDRSPVRLARAAALLARSGGPGEAARLLALLPAESPSRRVQADLRQVRAEILLARRRAAEAWRLFQDAARLEPPGVYLEYQARAAEAAGARGVATALYERMAADPAYYWRYRDDEGPGEWSSAVANYVRLARTERPAGAATPIVERFRALTHREVPRAQRPREGTYE